MKLDECFVKELKALNGDGSRESKFRTLSQVAKVAKAISDTDGRGTAEAVKDYGRAVVAAAIAATIKDREGRLGHTSIEWANAVLAIYTNHPASLMRAVIHDKLHPCKIEEYAANLIKFTQC